MKKRRGMARLAGRGQTGYSQPIPKAGIGGSPRFAARTPIGIFERVAGLGGNSSKTATGMRSVGPHSAYIGITMRTAIVHYWLLNRRGGEKVVDALCGLLPRADIY